jgi:1-acyl-sn-glycerol-3-phosphate acyltransferase
MKMILKKAHVYFYATMVALLYFLLWPIFYFFSRKPSRYATLDKIRATWGFLSSALAGFIYKFEYEEPIEWNRPYVICPNHTSNLDITAMCILVKNEHCFMGKEELLDNFVTKLFFKTVDITVNRESKMSSYRAFQKAVERIKQGISLIIFPEGAIPPHHPPHLAEFKNGPFRLAIEQQVPIVPVSSINAWKLLWDDGTKYGTHPGIVHFYVHKPIETTGMTVDYADALRDNVYEMIKRKTEGEPHPKSLSSREGLKKEILKPSPLEREG